MKKLYTFICALALTAIVMPAQAQTREDLVAITRSRQKWNTSLS